MHKIIGFAAVLAFIAVFTPVAPTIAHYGKSDRNDSYHTHSKSSLSLKFSPLVAKAASNSSYKNNYSSRYNDYKKPTATTTPKSPKPAVPAVPLPPVPPVTIPVPGVGEVQLNAYITGYSYWDNTPAGSADISHGVIHSKAGGTGTYSDPITLAVGHTISGGKDILDYPAGTKFYFPFLKKYAIVEDSCGDGNSPQNGPCHTGYKGNVWLDLYVGGQNASRSASDNCMNNITDVHAVIKNPGANYPVTAGAVADSGCKIY